MTLQGTVRKLDFKILKMSQKLNEKMESFYRANHTYMFPDMNNTMNF